MGHLALLLSSVSTGQPTHKSFFVIELNLFPQNNYISDTHIMYHHIIYINIMVKVEIGKVEVQYLYNTFPTS